MSAPLHIHLRAHRKERGLTLQDVADAIGIRNNTLSQWETGARQVDLADLQKLSAVYGVEPAALLMAPDEAARAKAMREAANLVSRLSEEDLKHWLNIGARLARP